MKIYVKLMGGAGNQLFSFAAAKKAASRLDAEVICDLSFLNYYSQPGTGITPRKFALYAFEGIQTVDAVPDGTTILEWEQVPQNRNSDVVMQGYFQDLKSLPEPEEIRSWYPFDVWEIRDGYTSIHVRRGDYVSAPNAAAFHGALNLHYYKAAIELVGHTRFYSLYSDDGDWCEENIVPLVPQWAYTLAKYRGRELATIWDMASGNGIVMANSTFSWWAAYLCGHNNVVYPSPWFRGGAPAPNIFKPEWKRIEC
jgi:hypothetical protein